MNAGVGAALGDTLDLSTGAFGGLGLLGPLLAIAALAIYMLSTADTGSNDDDDSSPGGGLMQPVA